MENTGQKLRRLRSNICIDGKLNMGIDVTLIPASVVQGVTITKTSHTLTAANGTEIKLLGEASLPITFVRYNNVITGLVSEHVAKVMPGID